MVVGESPEEGGNDLPPFDIEMLASSLRYDLRDLDVFLPTLIDKIASLQIGSVSLKRKKKFLGSGSLEKAELGMGDLVFRITPQASGSSPQCVISKVIGGVSVKNQQVTLEVWLKELIKETATRASQAGRDREAILKILGAS